MAQFSTLNSQVYVLPLDNIDTDQIIPARFLKATDKAGMGDALFADWRYQADGHPRQDFVLNRADLRGAQVLFVGDNFGCGSSREHAPWALTGFGMRAVISTSFADIFRNNALKNGLLPLEVSAEIHRSLMDQLAANSHSSVEINLETQTLRLPDGMTVTFPIDPFARTCLLNGIDELDYLLGFSEQITAYEKSTSENPCGIMVG